MASSEGTKDNTKIQLPDCSGFLDTDDPTTMIRHPLLTGMPDDAAEGLESDALIEELGGEEAISRIQLRLPGN